MQDATAGDTPLAVTVVGKGNNTSTIQLNLTVKHLLRSGGIDDTGSTYSPKGAWHPLVTNQGSGVYDTYYWQTINGSTWSETLFNGIEAGVQIVARTDGEHQLSQLCVEYIIEGPNALPSGFPRWSLAQAPVAISSSLLRR